MKVLLYYALFLVKGISCNFVKATYNYSCILCFLVLEHINKISNCNGEEGHGLNQNTLLSRGKNLSSDRNIKKKKKEQKNNNKKKIW